MIGIVEQYIGYEFMEPSWFFLTLLLPLFFWLLYQLSAPAMSIPQLAGVALPTGPTDKVAPLWKAPLEPPPGQNWSDATKGAGTSGA